MKQAPFLCLHPRLELVEGDAGECAAERGAIDRKSDTIKPNFRFACYQEVF